jgi:hypothetical protein
MENLLEFNAFGSQINESVGDGKAELIKILNDRLDSMSKDIKFSALDVAKVMYNDVAHWCNKTDIFKNRPGSPTLPKVPSIISSVGSDEFEIDN